MTAHAEAIHTESDHAADSHAPADGGLRFEKSELHDFIEDDRSAGEHVGILLAVVFLISLVLMVGVTAWTFAHQGQGHDPHAITGMEDDTHH